jgi:hypothetical protein
MIKYTYTVTSSDKGSIAADGFETDNFDSAMIIFRAIESTGFKATLSTKLAV